MQVAKTYDFIVIGSGIAGLNTALILAQFGKVLIVTKKKLSDSSTNLAQGGIAAVMKKEDSQASHIEDTVHAGYGHNKKTAVELLVNRGPYAVRKLEKLGVAFDREPGGELASSYEAAHSFPRIVHATDFTGKEIEKTLIAQINKEPKVTIFEDTMAADLIVKNNQCYGVQVMKNNKISNLYSRAIILATGGVGQLYQWTTNPLIATGDGIAIAWRAGVKLKDLEFVQFHPTALQENARHTKAPLLLLSEAIRGEGAVLLNVKNERFMQNYHPKKELAPRDVVALAIFNEQKNGPVYLDITHKGKEFITKRFPNISGELKKRGYDITKQSIPVTPAAHFLCGGIKTDLYGRTSIKNLFAYGETAATGVHGANRLASNSLLEGMVFPEQITACITKLPKTAVLIPANRLSFNSKENQTARNQIREIMWKYVGIVRTPQGLKKAKEKLETLMQQMEKLHGINKSLLETKNMLTVALLITKAAQKRKKSLGTHFTNDLSTVSEKTKIASESNLLQYTKDMQPIATTITLVIFRIDSSCLCIYLPKKLLPTETISQTESLDEQVKEIFSNNLGFPLGKNYVEQLYTLSKKKNEITIAYFVLLSKNISKLKSEHWDKINSKTGDPIISYAVQRLRWKLEYTNVVYSLLPKTFTLSELQRTYEIILGKKLDKRNFRKKILSLKFLKPTGEKRFINARPAQMYMFSKRVPQLVKVFS